MTPFKAPTIEYFSLSPILIILAVAAIGVLVEAFVPRTRRYVIQVALALVGLVAAFVTTLIVFNRLHPGATKPKAGNVDAMGALAVDGPALFCWLLILVLGVLSVLLFAERRLEGGVTGFAGQAAALPGTEAEREASTKGLEHTEVFAGPGATSSSASSSGPCSCPEWSRWSPRTSYLIRWAGSARSTP